MRDTRFRERLPTFARRKDFYPLSILLPFFASNGRNRRDFRRKMRGRRRQRRKHNAAEAWAAKASQC